MQLARRGGLPGHPVIGPEKVDGYIQSILGKNPNYVYGTDNQTQFANAGQHCNSDRLTSMVSVFEAVGKCIGRPVFFCEPLLGDPGGRPAGFSAEALVTSGISQQLADRELHERDRPVTTHLEAAFPPLKVCVGNPVEFSAVLGIVPGDLYFPIAMMQTANFVIF